MVPRLSFYLLGILSFTVRLRLARGAPQPDWEPRGKSIRNAPELHSDELAARLTYPISQRANSAGLAAEHVGPTLVLFHTPWCVECQRLRPAWDALSREFDYYEGVRVVAVNCDQGGGGTVGAGTRACTAHGVTSWPWVAAFAPPSPSTSTTSSSSDSTTNTSSIIFNSGVSPASVYWGDRTDAAALRQWVLAVAPQLKNQRAEATTLDATGAEKSSDLLLERSHVRAANGSVLCYAWRASANCDPEGPRAPQLDLDCRQPVLGNRAGFCDCGGDKDTSEGSSTAVSMRRIEKLSDCGHEYRQAFTCLDVCAPVAGCEGWKATSRCEAGTRRSQKDSSRDAGCRALISSDWSGSCVCGQDLETAVSNCSHAPFTCADECAKLHAANAAAEEEAAARALARRQARLAARAAAPVLTVAEIEAAAQRKALAEAAAAEQARAEAEAQAQMRAAAEAAAEAQAAEKWAKEQERVEQERQRRLKEAEAKKKKEEETKRKEEEDRKKAEEKAKKEAEEIAKKEADDKNKKEEEYKKETEEKAKKEAEEKARASSAAIGASELLSAEEMDAL